MLQDKVKLFFKNYKIEVDEVDACLSALCNLMIAHRSLSTYWQYTSVITDDMVKSLHENIKTIYDYIVTNYPTENSHSTEYLTIMGYKYGTFVLMIHIGEATQLTLYENETLKASITL